jgi:TFIIF-interacting CTD phosphatase-like protein
LLAQHGHESQSHQHAHLPTTLYHAVMTRISPLVVALDLDETLVHSRPTAIPDRPPAFWWAGLAVYVRPGARELILERAAHGVVGVWTASDANYALPVLERVLRGPLDPLAFVLTRRSCVPRDDGELLKPLGELFARHPPSRVVLVDNRPASYALHPEHGQSIPDFTGDPADRALHALSEHLRRLDDPTVDVRTTPPLAWTS